MPEYDNRSRGVLFKNDRKESDTHPDYKGSYTDEQGREFWLSAWIKKTKAGVTFMSLSTKPKDEKSKQARSGEENQERLAVTEDAPF